MSSLLVACSKDDVSAEQQIRIALIKLESAIEVGSTFKAGEFLTDHYQDKFHRNKRAAMGRLMAYMLRHKNIHLYSFVKNIEITGDTAKAIVLLASTAKPVNDKESLLAINADLYRFELNLVVDDDEWLIQSAKWHRVKLSSL